MGPHESLSRGGELTHLGIIDRVGKTRKSVCVQTNVRPVKVLQCCVQDIPPRLSHLTHRGHIHSDRDLEKRTNAPLLVGPFR